MRKTAIGFCLLFFGLTVQAQAQVDCQAIMNQLLSGMGGPGVYSGGAENLANIYNTYCQGGQRQYTPQQPRQQVGDYCSNGGTCPVGSRCSAYANRCVPVGMVDCGNYSCQPGNKCSSAGCIAQEARDCGNGKYCSEGTVCWTAREAIPGIVKKGDLKCPTSGEAQRLNERIAELERQKKLEKEMGIAQKKREAEEKKVAERKKIEEQRQAARKKEEERLAGVARKKQEALEAKQKAEETKRLAAQAEAKRKADEAAQRAAAAETKRRAAVETKQKADEAKRAEDALLKSLQADQERRRAAETAAKRNAEAEAKQRAAEAKLLAAEAQVNRRKWEAKQRAEEAEAKRKADAEAKQRADEARRLAAEAKQKAMQAESAEDALPKNLPATRSASQAQAAPTGGPGVTAPSVQGAKPIGNGYSIKEIQPGIVQVFQNSKYLGTTQIANPPAGTVSPAGIGTSLPGGMVTGRAAMVPSSAGAVTGVTSIGGGFAPSNDFFRSVMNDPGRSPAERSHAAAVLALNMPATSYSREMSGYLLGLPQPVPGLVTPIAKSSPGASATLYRPYLGAGQQAIDKAFSPATPTPSAGVPSRADDILRAVMNDPNRPLSDRQDAARALNDTPTFREIMTFGLGKDPATFGPIVAPVQPRLSPTISQPGSSVSAAVQPSAAAPRAPSGTTSPSFTSSSPPKEESTNRTQIANLQTGALTPAQIQFFTNNNVNIASLPSGGNGTAKSGVSSISAPTASVTGFTTRIQIDENRSVWDRLDRSFKFANQSVGNDPNFQAGKKELKIAAAVGSAGCFVGGGVGALAGGVGAIPGCVGGAAFATGVYGAATFGVDVAKGVLDLAKRQYGKGTAQVVQTVAEEFANHPSNVGGITPAVKVGGSWGTYFLYGFYSNVPGQ